MQIQYIHIKGFFNIIDHNDKRYIIKRFWKHFYFQNLLVAIELSYSLITALTNMSIIVIKHIAKTSLLVIKPNIINSMNVIAKYNKCFIM